MKQSRGWFTAKTTQSATDCAVEVRWVQRDHADALRPQPLRHDLGVAALSCFRRFSAISTVPAVPDKMVRTIASSSAWDCARNPAPLLTSTSTCPSSSPTWSAQRRTDAGSVRSHRSAWAPGSSSRVRCAAARSRAVITTVASSAANRRAIVRPKPLPPPLTTTFTHEMVQPPSRWRSSC